MRAPFRINVCERATNNTHPGGPPISHRSNGSCSWCANGPAIIFRLSLRGSGQSHQPLGPPCCSLRGAEWAGRQFDAHAHRHGARRRRRLEGNALRPGPRPSPDENSSVLWGIPGAAWQIGALRSRLHALHQIASTHPSISPRTSEAPHTRVDRARKSANRRFKKTPGLSAIILNNHHHPTIAALPRAVEFIDEIRCRRSTANAHDRPKRLCALAVFEGHEISKSNMASKPWPRSMPKPDLRARRLNNGRT